MSNNGPRRSGSNWRDLEDDPRGNGLQDDPLSELARLIEEDPFADFDHGRSAAKPQAPREERHAWPWDDEPRTAAGTSQAQDEPDDLPVYETDEWGQGYAAADDGAEHVEPAFSEYDEPRAAADWDLDAPYRDEYAANPDEYAYDEDGQPLAPEDEAYRPGLDYREGDPNFDESGHLAPLAAEESGGRRRKTAVFAALALLAVVGGVGAYFYREMAPATTDGAPILVAAETDPVRVRPENPGGQPVPDQDRIVFDRASGNVPAKSEERIVSREEPVEAVPLREQDGQNSGMAADPAEAPRRVRTVVVKPDGTIVEEPEAPAEQVVAMRDTSATTTSDGAGPVTLYDAGPLEPEAAADGPAGTDAATPADATAETAETTSDGVPVPPARPADRPRVASNTAEPSPNFVPPSASEARQPAPAANNSAGRPMQLVPSAADAAQPAPQAQPAQQVASAPAAATGSNTGSFPAGGYVVQVSSTRAQADAEATASRVQQSYQNVLSGYQTTVQRADLGDRGVYYRVAVGPLADSNAAAGLCSRLKSAGLDCFVRRN